MWQRVKIGSAANDVVLFGSSLVMLQEGRVLMYSEACVKRVYERVVALPVCVSEAGVVGMGVAGRVLVLGFSDHLLCGGCKYVLSPRRRGAVLVALATAPEHVATGFDSGEVVVWRFTRLGLACCRRVVLPWPPHGLQLGDDGVGVVVTNGDKWMCVTQGAQTRLAGPVVAVGAGGVPVELGAAWSCVGRVAVRDLGSVARRRFMPVAVRRIAAGDAVRARVEMEVRVGRLQQPWRVLQGCLRVCSRGLLVLQPERILMHMYAVCPHCGEPAPYDTLRYTDLLILGARGLFAVLPPCILRELVVMRRVQCSLHSERNTA